MGLGVKASRVPASGFGALGLGGFGGFGGGLVGVWWAGFGGFGGFGGGLGGGGGGFWAGAPCASRAQRGARRVGSLLSAGRHGHRSV